MLLVAFGRLRRSSGTLLGLELWTPGDHRSLSIWFLLSCSETNDNAFGWQNLNFKSNEYLLPEISTASYTCLTTAAVWSSPIKGSVWCYSVVISKPQSLELLPTSKQSLMTSSCAAHGEVGLFKFSWCSVSCCPGTLHAAWLVFR